MEMARYLVCGSRTFTDKDKLDRYLKVLPVPEAFISGMATGADLLSALWCQEHWPTTSLLKYPVSPADWKHFGFAAGPLRNRRMAVEGKPTLILAFPSDPNKISDGTVSMINIGLELKIPTYYAGATTWVQVLVPLQKQSR